MTDAVRVLVVDDDAHLRRSVRRALNGGGLEVVDAESGELALRMLEKGLEPEVVMLDYRMPGRQGDEVLRDIHAMRPNLPVVMCSGDMDMKTKERLVELGAAACLEKPITIVTLIPLLEMLADERRQKLRQRSSGQRGV